MAGNDSEVCHSCRLKGHFFDDCLTKRRCPRCNNGFQKCFKVERNTPNKGKFFNCCCHKCEFCEWCDIGESSGDYSDVSHTEIDDMSRMFQSQVQLKDEEEIHISLNVTIRKK